MKGIRDQKIREFAAILSDHCDGYGHAAGNLSIAFFLFPDADAILYIQFLMEKTGCL